MWTKTRNPDQQRLEANFFPGSLPPVKDAFIMETKTVNADTKFITRGITQQVGKHTKIICLVQMIEGREAHLERECGCLPY